MEQRLDSVDVCSYGFGPGQVIQGNEKAEAQHLTTKLLHQAGGR